MIIIKYPVYHKHHPEISIYIGFAYIRVNVLLKLPEVFYYLTVLEFFKDRLIGHFNYILEICICKGTPVKVWYFRFIGLLVDGGYL